MQFDARVWNATINYHDGLRYPDLERVAGTPTRLDGILKAR